MANPESRYRPTSSRAKRRQVIGGHCSRQDREENDHPHQPAGRPVSPAASTRSSAERCLLGRSIDRREARICRTSPAVRLSLPSALARRSRPAQPPTGWRWPNRGLSQHHHLHPGPGQRHHIGRTDRNGIGERDVDVVHQSRVPARFGKCRVSSCGNWKSRGGGSARGARRPPWSNSENSNPNVTMSCPDMAPSREQPPPLFSCPPKSDAIQRDERERVCGGDHADEHKGDCSTTPHLLETMPRQNQESASNSAASGTIWTNATHPGSPTASSPFRDSPRRAWPGGPITD